MSEPLYLTRMPPGAKILRKLRGSVTLIEKDIVATTLYAKGSDIIPADFKKCDLPKGWRFGRRQTFDYIIVRTKVRSNKIVLKKVKEKRLSKKQIERIKRQVEKSIPKNEF